MIQIKKAVQSSGWRERCPGIPGAQYGIRSRPVNIRAKKLLGAGCFFGISGEFIYI